MNAFVTWVFARLREPSTWAGIGVAVGGLTFLPAAEIAVASKVIALAATVVPGVIAIVLPDGPKA